MIDRGYCLLMARYNAWQNKQLRDITSGMTAAELTKDRKAFFGSILSTLNHILWADTLWMSRLSNVAPPPVPASENTRMTATVAEWSAARFKMDGRMLIWAETLSSLDLLGDLSWTTQLDGKTMRKPMADCVIGVFNHQTHHRGQVHAMLTAAGNDAPVTDVVLMPDKF